MKLKNLYTKVSGIFLLLQRMIFLFSVTCLSVAKPNDTIHLDFNQIAILADTTYYGLQDSIVIIPDSVNYSILKNRLLRSKKFYEKREERSGFSNFLHEEYVNFIRNQYRSPDVKIDKALLNSDEYFTKEKGKIIRNIEYRKVALLAGNVLDTNIVAESKFVKLMDSWHVHTRDWVLKNNTRFNKYDKLNPRILSDNERIFRNLPYIEDSRIYVSNVKNYPDSVDILIVTKDNFPLGMGGEIKSYDHFTVEPYTRNFLGFGHNLQGAIIFKAGEKPPVGYGLEYKVDNVLGTFTSAKFKINNTYEQTLTGLTIEKPFLSTDIKYGGGFELNQLNDKREYGIIELDTTYVVEPPFKHNLFDIWFGRSFFFSNDLQKPFVNISLRYANTRFIDKPIVAPDTNYAFHDRTLILGGLTLQKVSFLKTTKLLGFGITEDVPYGFVFRLTTGFDRTSFYRRPYVSGQFDWAVPSTTYGYVSWSTVAGTFFDTRQHEDLYIGSQIRYYSPLIFVGRFILRNFSTLTAEMLSNPLYYYPLNFGKGIRGLKQDGILGTSDLVFRYQPVFYTPYRLIGFKFSVYPYVDAGWLTRNEFFRGQKRFYLVYGLGTSIKNESLTFPALTLQVGFYPNWIDKGYHFGFSIIFRDVKFFDLSHTFKPLVAQPGFFY